MSPVIVNIIAICIAAAAARAVQSTHPVRAAHPMSPDEQVDELMSMSEHVMYECSNELVAMEGTWFRALGSDQSG